MRETPHTAIEYSPCFFVRSKNFDGHGDNPQGRSILYGNPQRLYVRDEPMKLDAEWVTGFVDGEGCFYVGVNKHADMTAKFQVLPEFTVVQHKRDVTLLYALKEFFRCGVVRSNHGDRMAYRVRGIKHLSEIIIPFFMRYPLKSKKKMDFEKFSKILIIIQKGDHLKADGISRICEIANQMNRGKLR
jgi:hypothetical protein